MKTKLLILALFTQLFTLSASAYDAKVGSIYYNLNTSNNTAEVTSGSHNLGVATYSGSISIPTSISYKNESYKVTAIGYGAFSSCTDLTSISIPTTITVIDHKALSGCTSLKSVTIPASVKEISSLTFLGCTGLTSVSIPATITKIGHGAFKNCSKLASINIPSSVSFIDYEAFAGTPWYKSWYDSQQDGLCYINTVLYAYKGTMPPNTSIVVNEGTTCIGGGAFQGCSNLVSIKLPESLTSIGACAFVECGLKSITFPASLSILGDMVFRKCTSLKSIEIPSAERVHYITAYLQGSICEDCESLISATLAEGIKEIKSGDFRGCVNLTTVTLPYTIERIISSAFTNCNNLSTVKVGMYNPITIDSETFANRFLATLIVPDGCKAAYEAAEYWQDFQEIKEESEVIPDPEPGEDTDISLLSNVIYLEKTEVQSGSTATLSFKMKNSAAIRGFQFDLYLPEGVTAVKNAKGRIQGSLISGRLPEDDEHTLTISEQTDGAIRFLCGSQYDETFTGNEGEIATLQVNIAENMEDGDYPIVLKEMRLSESDINKYYDTEYLKSTLTVYIRGDINGDKIVNVSDYIGIANHILGIPQDVFIEKAGDVDGDNTVNVSDYIGVANIILTGSPYGSSNNVKPAYLKARSTDLSTMDNFIYVEPTTVDAGSQVTLSFMMKNTAAIRGFQFDLYLPDGVTAVKNAKGRIQGSLSDGRLPEDDEHTLTIQEQADGAIRFLCGSQYDEAFMGTTGEIATLIVNIGENMANGDYPIVLRNMRLTETDISKYYDSDNVETTLMVGDSAPKICAKPTIYYENGKLIFDCDTEGAICQSTITDDDINSYSGNEVQLCVVYNISVYATKPGYSDSDVTTGTLCWIDAEPKTEGIQEDAVTEVKALPVLIQTQGGNITIQGTTEGTPIAIYSIDGKEYGSATSEKERTTISTSLQPGTVAVVKIGEKAVKVLVK